MADSSSNEDIEIRVSEGQSVKATDAVSKGLEGVEKNAVQAQAAVESLGASVQKLEVLTRQVSQTSINRTVQAAERRAQFANASPLEQAKLRTSIDLSRVAGDQTASNRVIAAGALEYQKLSDAANAAARAQLAAADKAILLANARAASSRASEGTNAFAAAEEKVAKDRLAREQELRSFIDKSHKASIAETEQRAVSAAKAAAAQSAEVEALKSRAAVAGLSKIDQLVVQRNALTAGSRRQHRQDQGSRSRIRQG